MFALSLTVYEIFANEWIEFELNEFYNLYPARETRGSSPGVYSSVVDGN